MPRIRIPQTGTFIDWPSAEAGRVRVTAKLNVPGNNSSVQIRLVELSFKRDPFRKLFKQSDYWYGVRTIFDRIIEKRPASAEELGQLVNEQELDLFLHALTRRYDPDRPTPVQSLRPDELLKEWGWDIFTILHDSMGSLTGQPFTFAGFPQSQPRTLKQLQVLHGSFCKLDYRLRIDREDLRALQPCFVEKETAWNMWGHVQQNLLPSQLIDLALRGLARGHEHAQERRDLMAITRCAVYVAEELVRRTDHDPDLRARLHRTLAKEGYGSSIRKPLQILALADRALRPAQEKFGLEWLGGRKLSALLDAASRKELAEMFESYPESSLITWFDLLFGQDEQGVLKLLERPRLKSKKLLT